MINIQKLLISSGNLFRRLVVGILLTALIACFFVLIVEFQHNRAIQIVGSIIIALVLWFIIKVDSWLFEVATDKQNT